MLSMFGRMAGVTGARVPLQWMLPVPFQLLRGEVSLKRGPESLNNCRSCVCVMMGYSSEMGQPPLCKCVYSCRFVVERTRKVLYKSSPCFDLYLCFCHREIPLSNRTKWENGVRQKHLFGTFQWKSATSAKGECPWNVQKFHVIGHWWLHEISTDVSDVWNTLIMTKTLLTKPWIWLPHLCSWTFPDFSRLICSLRWCPHTNTHTHRLTQSPLVRNSSLISVMALELQRVCGWLGGCWSQSPHRARHGRLISNRANYLIVVLNRGSSLTIADKVHIW